MAWIQFGLTLGTPIGFIVWNKDHRPKDYGEMDDCPRPSHADFTYQYKYGIRASSGGGRSSARETIGRVGGGAIAEKWLNEKYGTEIVAWVSRVHNIIADPTLEQNPPTRQEVDQNIVRCPDSKAAEKMIQVIREARDAKDSVGGVVTLVVKNPPMGLGEPCFDKLEAILAHAMLSIPATKGFEIGSGFRELNMFGSEHNDPFIKKTDAQGNTYLGTATNRSGGIQGGISNKENIVVRVAFKPPATIGKEQPTTAFNGKQTVLAAKGRHDPAVVARAIPIVESMAALALADAALIQESRTQASSQYPFVGRARHVPDYAISKL